MQMNGWYEDLTNCVSDPAYDFADFAEGAVGTTTVNDVLTGVPIVTEQEVLYYRKDLLEAAGIAVPTQFSSFLYSMGGDWFDENRQATINTPEALAAIDLYATLLREYGPPGVLNMSWPQAVERHRPVCSARWPPEVTSPHESANSNISGFGVLPVQMTDRSAR